MRWLAPAVASFGPMLRADRPFCTQLHPVPPHSGDHAATHGGARHAVGPSRPQPHHGPAPPGALVPWGPRSGHHTIPGRWQRPAAAPVAAAPVAAAAAAEARPAAGQRCRAVPAPRPAPAALAAAPPRPAAAAWRQLAGAISSAPAGGSSGSGRSRAAARPAPAGACGRMRRRPCTSASGSSASSSMDGSASGSSVGGNASSSSMDGRASSSSPRPTSSSASSSPSASSGSGPARRAAGLHLHRQHLPLLQAGASRGRRRLQAGRPGAAHPVGQHPGQGSKQRPAHAVCPFAWAAGSARAHPFARHRLPCLLSPAPAALLQCAAPPLPPPHRSWRWCWCARRSSGGWAAATRWSPARRWPSPCTKFIPVGLHVSQFGRWLCGDRWRHAGGGICLALRLLCCRWGPTLLLPAALPACLQCWSARQVRR